MKIILSIILLYSTSSIAGTLESDFIQWKQRVSSMQLAKTTPIVRTEVVIPTESISVEKTSEPTSFTPISSVQKDKLFSNLVSDPDVKAKLEEAYKKPNAVIMHATVE